MQALEAAYTSASNLYWIAFLLTGCSELSLDLTVEALGSDHDSEPLPCPAAFTRIRRTVIVRALAAVRDELTLSAGRTATRQPAPVASPPPGWSLDPYMSKEDLESALLAIDIFPRCTLVLTVFEGMTLGDAAILLRSHPELVVKGRTDASWELTCNLASLDKVTRPTRFRVLSSTATA